MEYVITGSLGNICKLVVQILVAANHHVTVITSKKKVIDIEAIGAFAKVASVEDEIFLRTFLLMQMPCN